MSATTSTGCARATRTSSAAGSPAMCRADPAPTQSRPPTSRLRSISTRSTRRSGKGATAPGAYPVASSTSAAPATRAFAAPARAATFCGSARRSPGTSTRTGRPSHSKSSDLTIWRNSQPTARAASSAVGVPVANSSIRASAPASRSALLTLATGSGHDSAVTGPSTGASVPSDQRDELGIVEALGVDPLDELGRGGRVDRQRHQGLATLLRPRDGHVRDVHAGLAEQRADAADHAGDVVVAEEDEVRRQLDVDAESERAGKEEARLGTD